MTVGASCVWSAQAAQYPTRSVASITLVGPFCGDTSFCGLDWGDGERQARLPPECSVYRRDLGEGFWNWG